MLVPLTPIPDDAVDLTFSKPAYGDDFSATVGNAGSDSDGFETIFSDMAAHLADGPNVLAGLDGILSEVGSIGDPAALPFESDFSGSLAATISQGQPDFNAFSTHLTGSNPPPPGSGGGKSGGSGAPSSNCSQRTNQYGLSKTGNFQGVHCDQHLTFQVLRVQDGPCTYSAAPAASAGATALPKISSFTLVTGDPAVWKLAHHTERASDGTPFDVFDVTIAPKAVGHFDATGTLLLSNPNKRETLCMSVDCIA